MILVNTEYISGKELEMLGWSRAAPFDPKTLEETLPRALKRWWAVS